LRVVDANGEVFDLDEYSDPVEENRALRSALTRSENANRTLRAQLAAERQKSRLKFPVDSAFEMWRKAMVEAGMKGKARCKITDDRCDAMRKLFEAEYTLEDFELMIAGLAAAPFVRYGKRYAQGSEQDRQVDIGYVCEKASRFEEAARIGARVKRQ
jgi:hypothetical protein